MNYQIHFWHKHIWQTKVPINRPFICILGGILPALCHETFNLPLQYVFSHMLEFFNDELGKGSYSQILAGEFAVCR
jgi:hypothetical protein